MFTLLEARLARELGEESGLSVADYTVLSNLAEAEGRRWRLTDLARHMRWSQSRLSHQVARMERRGLVARGRTAEDGRGTVLTLTRAGLKTIAAATPGHLRGVLEHFIKPLTDEQLAAFGDIADTIVSHLEQVDEADLAD